MAYIDFRARPRPTTRSAGGATGSSRTTGARSRRGRWLELMAERELGDDAGRRRRTAAPAPLLVLSQPDSPTPCAPPCATCTGPTALAGNPLLRSARGARRAAPSRRAERARATCCARRSSARRRRPARRAARARARPHVPAARADPGARRRGARAAVQHLPPPPRARRRARRRLAVAARAARPGRVSRKIEQDSAWRVSTAPAACCLRT